MQHLMSFQALAIILNTKVTQAMANPLSGIFDPTNKDIKNNNMFMGSGIILQYSVVLISFL